MQIHTTARHCKLEPEIRRFAEDRVQKFQRLARDIHEASIIVTAEKYRHTAEITLKLRHQEVVSREEATEARMAIDLAADAAEEQLRRIKERRIDRRRNGAAAGDPAGAPAGPDGGEPDELWDEEG
jgi:putative sigma-54 modulation protein